MANYTTYFTKCTIMVINKHYQESCDQIENFMNQFVSKLMASMFRAGFVRPINQCYNQLKNDSLQEQLRQNGSLSP